MSGNGACFSSFRECSHYGPPETLFAFGKRLIHATPHHAVLQWTWFSDHASTVETFGVTASDISPSWKSQRIPMITVSNKRRSTAVSSLTQPSPNCDEFIAVFSIDQTRGLFIHASSDLHSSPHPPSECRGVAHCVGVTFYDRAFVPVSSDAGLLYKKSARDWTVLTQAVEPSSSHKTHVLLFRL